MRTQRPLQMIANARFVCLLAATLFTCAAHGAEVFVRFKVVEPQGEQFKATTGGFRHDGKHDQWYLPKQTVEVAGRQWSAWLDAGKWDLHGRLDREGGIAEWPAMKIGIARAAAGQPAIAGCAIAVELADKPEDGAAVVSFTERSGSNTICFLLPWPLREKKSEFETGSQMVARHLAWAREAAGGRARTLKKFDLVTSLWGPYDPALAEQSVQALELLGFNVIGGVPVPVMRAHGLRGYGVSWHLEADPEKSADEWRKRDAATIATQLKTPDGRWQCENTAYYVLSDEIQTLDFRRTDPAKLNGWFREYLKSKGESGATLGRPLESIAYPAQAMYEKTLPHGADLPTRKIMYHAGKIGQWWSVQQLRQTTDLVRETFRAAQPPLAMKTETLPSDHGFFNAWGAPHIGMSYRLLDLFEIGRQEAVDILSVEDWLGLNHMYGPNSTWTGAQAVGYLSAIMRSGIGARNVALRALLTPSDDGFLRLKACSALGQGAKSFFFWTFGPTYIGTENYWSDLRSEYDGIAKLTRALERAEDILFPAAPVRDPVAILYSVSHDMWHTDDPASFVEMRLTWHALRHLSLQPDFLREEDVEAGSLADYKVLYVTGQCLTRKAAVKIGEWVNAGGVLYLAGGAATRDEFYEPYVPQFAAQVWPADTARTLIKETGHSYNERADLPKIKPLTSARLTLTDGTGEAAGAPGVVIKVIGLRANLQETPAVLGRFEDGQPAAAIHTHGKGRVLAAGFLPGLAYSPFKAGQKTLDEVWPDGPRELIGLPLKLAGIRPVARASLAVVETSLLTGPAGSALVLANYTYKPIAKLRVELRVARAPAKAVSTEGVPVNLSKTADGVALELPLEWTDILLLPNE